MVSRALNKNYSSLIEMKIQAIFFKPVTAIWSMADEQWIWALSLD